MLKSFTMKQDNIADPRHLDLATDEQGCLYNRQVREVMARFVPAELLPGVEAMSALGYAARLLHLNMERAIEKHGLSETRLRVLLMLRHAGGAAPLGVLATRMHVSARNVTGLVDNLERDGLVARSPDPADRRSVRAELTERGRACIDPLWEETAQRQRALLEGFSPEELAQLRHLSLKVVKKLQETSQIGRESFTL